MLPVVVRVENLETKATVQHVFHRSPVHIGRNKLNELPLSDGFVSLWHGILRFDENTLEYLDLDSTNGTEVDGRRLRRNVFVPVTEQTDLRIGSLRLHLCRSEAVASEPEINVTLFGQRTMHLALQQSGPETPASPPTATVLFKPAMARAPASPAIARALPDEQSPGVIAGSFFGLYENYRQAWRTLHAQLAGKIAPLPDEKRSATLQLLQQRFPALEQEEQFRALRESLVTDVPAPPERSVDEQPEARNAPGALTLLRNESASVASPRTPFVLVRPQTPAAEGAFRDASADGAAASTEGASPTFRRPGGLQSVPPSTLPRPLGPLAPPRATSIEGRLEASTSLLRIFAQTYASESAELRSAEDVERFLNQLSAVLEAFAKAFLELRRGHDQFGKEIAVPMIGDKTPLRHAKTPRDLLRYLLDSQGQGADRIRSLTEGFADVMIHQVALLNGIRQGIGALLAYLSPDELRRSSALSRSGAGSLLLKTWPFGAMALWSLYLARHQELLQEEKTVQSVVFGSEFAFAYAQIVGGNVKV